MLSDSRKLGTAGQKLGGAAVLCHIKHDPTDPGGSFTLTSANVGKCQTVLCRNGKPLPLSRSYVMSCEEERKRIKQHKAIITEVRRARFSPGWQGGGARVTAEAGNIPSLQGHKAEALNERSRHHRGIMNDFSMASLGPRLCPVPRGLSSPEAHQLFCEGSGSGLEGARQDPLLGSGYPDSAACRLGLGSL